MYDNNTETLTLNDRTFKFSSPSHTQPSQRKKLHTWDCADNSRHYLCFELVLAQPPGSQQLQGVIVETTRHEHDYTKQARPANICAKKFVDVYFHDEFSCVANCVTPSVNTKRAYGWENASHSSRRFGYVFVHLVGKQMNDVFCSRCPVGYLLRELTNSLAVMSGEREGQR